MIGRQRSWRKRAFQGEETVMAKALRKEGQRGSKAQKDAGEEVRPWTL